MRRRAALLFSLLTAPVADAHDIRLGACPAVPTEQVPDVSRGLYGLELPDRATVRVLADCSILPRAGVEVAEITIHARTGTLQPAKPNHSHRTYELLYVLSGTLRYGLEGRVYEVGPGDMALVRPDSLIFHEPVGQTPVKLLAIWAPAGALIDLQNRFGFTPLDDPHHDKEDKKQ